MIECVHAYWLLLWLIGLFSRYSHRNCIINYPRRCHGRTMESPDEYLGRLNFLGTHGVKGHHGALLRWKDGRSVVCVCVCEAVQASMVHARAVSAFPGRHAQTHTNTHRASLPPPLPLILFQYLFIVTLSACVGRLGGGDQERGGGCVCVLALASDEPFCLACLSLSCWQRSLQHYSKARRHFKHERDIKKRP